MVIAIIAILASLLLPALGKAREKARALACASQLRQIGTAMFMYIGDFSDRYPYANVSEAGSANPVSWDDVLGMGYDGRELTVAQTRTAYFDVRPGSSTLTGGEGLYACPSMTRNPNGVHPRQTYDGWEGGGWGTDRAHARTYAMNTGGRAWFDGVLRPRGIAGWKSDVADMPSWGANTIPSPSKTLLLVEIPNETFGASGRASVLGNIGGTANHPYGQTNSYTVAPYHNGLFNYVFCDGHIELLDPLDTVGTGGPGTFEQDAKGLWTRETGD